jgi:hypothetical protein
MSRKDEARVIPLQPRPVDEFEIVIPPSDVPLVLNIRHYRPRDAGLCGHLRGLLRLSLEGIPILFTLRRSAYGGFASPSPASGPAHAIREHR